MKEDGGDQEQVGDRNHSRQHCANKRENKDSDLPTCLNQTTRNWHAGSTRKHTVPMYAGRDVYESHVV